MVAINPGNSGGALVDCAGKLVGVPTAGATVPSSSGEPATSNIQLEELTLTKKPGDTVSIGYDRGRSLGQGNGHPGRAAMSWR